jgi:transposase, IS30 family
VLSSSRRVKKGPGRRPQSAKRQRFMELRERGWSILAAAREVGVSRTTGNNWSRGYKTYRLGQVVGFVSALERLAVRHISPRFLSQEERIEIADLHHAGLSIRQIAHRLGRAASTVSRELRRNATKSRAIKGHCSSSARVEPNQTGHAHHPRSASCCGSNATSEPASRVRSPASSTGTRAGAERA